LQSPVDEEVGGWVDEGHLPNSPDARSAELTIILPAYNEGGRISIGLRTLLACIDGGDLGRQAIELIVVDDGSDDDTAAQAEGLLASFPGSLVVRLPENRGKGAAIREGVARAHGDIVVFMDIDMAAHPSQLPLLLAALDENDVAIGSRSIPGSATQDDTVLRTFTGRTFSRMTQALIGLPFRDTQCGFKALRAPVARVLFHYADVDRFAFDVELLSTAVRLDLRVAEVPVRWVQVGGSRIRPLADPASMLADLFRIRRRRGDESIDAIVIRSGPRATTRFESLRSLLSSLLPRPEWDDPELALCPLSGADEVARVLRLLQTGDETSGVALVEEHFGRATPLTGGQRIMPRHVATLCAGAADQPQRLAD